MRTVEWFACVEAQGGNWKLAFTETRTLNLVEKSDLKSKLPSWMKDSMIASLRGITGDVIHLRKFSEDELKAAFEVGDPST